MFQKTNEEVPIEDYNEENDYSLGMNRVLRILAFALTIISLGLAYVR